MKTSHNPQAEACILSAIFQGADLQPVLAMAPADFFSAFYRRVFAYVLPKISAGEPIALAAVQSGMNLDEQETSLLAGLLDPLYLIRRPGELAAHVETVKRLASERALKLAAENFLNSNGDSHAPLLALKNKFDVHLGLLANGSAQSEPLRSCSTAELFTAQERKIDWVCWPFAAPGLATILDALPKVGKTIFLLEGIRASRESRPFLNFPTKFMRVVYVSEQSRPSLAMQARQCGFDGSEPASELRWISREDWSRHVYQDFLSKLENEILKTGNYNTLILDTFHTVSRMENEWDATETTRLGNLTLDVASRNNLALILSRHDRKSGGDIGVSGRSSIALSGLVDVICHLVRDPTKDTARKLELLGRIPNLPSAQTIELVDGEYLNCGTDSDRALNEETALVSLFLAEPAASLRTIEQRTGIGKNRVRKIAESLGWSRDEESGQWKKISD